MERLRLLRRRAGLTQHQLALRADMQPESVRGYESGRHLPRIDAAVKLATALGCTLGQLAGTEPPPDGLTDPAAK